MTQTEYFNCPECGESSAFSTGNGTYKEQCDACIKKEKEDNHLAELEKLPMDKRMRILERWMYNHKNHSIGDEF